MIIHVLVSGEELEKEISQRDVLFLKLLQLQSTGRRLCFDNLTTLYVGIPSGQDEMNLAAYFVSRQLPSVTMGYSIYRR